MNPSRPWRNVIRLNTMSTTSGFDSLESFSSTLEYIQFDSGDTQRKASGMTPSGRTVRDYGLWPDDLLYALRSKGWRPTELEWRGKTPDGRNTKTWCIAYMDAGGFTALFQQGDHDWKIAPVANPGKPDLVFSPDEVHKVIDWINTNS